ncbi:hypothetical protein ACOI1H_23010 [Loktanella sp. DJP18]|uniref:hypothetical protein n=1 Tax=Loktanella sp. DJP18 TaxID=3409788 RepID=UPI003BB5D574
MLDATTSSLDSDIATGWHDHIAYGDVVYFRIPEVKGADHAVASPYLVLDTLGDPRYAVLAPAFPSRRPSISPRIVSVGRRAELHAAGLHRPTEFRVDQRILVPVTHHGFVPSALTGSPVIGRVIGAGMERLNVARGRLHALFDMRDMQRHDGTPSSQRRGPHALARSAGGDGHHPRRGAATTTPQADSGHQ